MIIRNMIKCLRCGDIIESFYRHDFKECSCGACAVDGGHDYLRRVGNREDWEDLSEVEPDTKTVTVSATPYVLHRGMLEVPRELVGKDLKEYVYKHFDEIDFEEVDVDYDDICIEEDGQDTGDE